MRDPIRFEGMRGRFFYEQIAFRKPRTYEYFLSGADVIAYQAYSDLRSRYHIVRPTHKAIPNPIKYVKGEKV